LIFRILRATREQHEKETAGNRRIHVRRLGTRRGFRSSDTDDSVSAVGGILFRPEQSDAQSLAVPQPDFRALPARLPAGTRHTERGQDLGPDHDVELDDVHRHRTDRPLLDQNSAFCRIFVRHDPHTPNKNRRP